MKKILTNISLVFVIGVILAYFILFTFGINPYIIISGSMEPTIHTGSLCFVNTVASYEDIREGDIIAFKTAMGDQVTHRAVAVTPEGIETKGDANEVSDGLSTTRENFIGISIFSIPCLGYVAAFLQKPVGKTIIGILIVIIVALGIIDYIETKRDKVRITSSD